MLQDREDSGNSWVPLFTHKGTQDARGHDSIVQTGTGVGTTDQGRLMAGLGSLIEAPGIAWYNSTCAPCTPFEAPQYLALYCVPHSVGEVDTALSLV